MCWSPTFLRKMIFSTLSWWCEQCMVPGWPRLERQSTCMLVCREHSQVLCKRYVDTQFSSLEMPRGIIYLLTPFPRAWLLWTHSTTFGQSLNLTHKHLTLSAKSGFCCCWGWWMSLETTHRFTFNFSLASPYLQVRWRSIELTSSNMWVGGDALTVSGFWASLVTHPPYPTFRWFSWPVTTSHDWQCSSSVLFTRPFTSGLIRWDN